MTSSDDKVFKRQFGSSEQQTSPAKLYYDHNGILAKISLETGLNRTQTPLSSLVESLDSIFLMFSWRKRFVRRAITVNRILAKWSIYNTRLCDGQLACLVRAKSIKPSTNLSLRQVICAKYVYVASSTLPCNNLAFWGATKTKVLFGLSLVFG